MRTRRATTLAGIASLLLVACGSDDPMSTDTDTDTDTNSTAGGHAQQLFANACGSCHMLSAAGTRGSVGPPLDKTTLDAGAITRQIRTGAPGMPPDLLRGKDTSAVASYVAEQARFQK